MTMKQLCDKPEVTKRLVSLYIKGCDSECKKCLPEIVVKCEAHDPDIQQHIKQILFNGDCPRVMKAVVEVLADGKEELPWE